MKTNASHRIANGATQIVGSQSDSTQMKKTWFGGGLFSLVVVHVHRTPASMKCLPERPRPIGVEAIADLIEGRVDDITDKTVQSIRAEIPAYRVRGETIADSTRSAAHRVYASFIDTLRTGREPNEMVARSLATVGADRAAQGIPLDDLLHAFRISARTMAAAIWAAVSKQDLDRDAALWIGEAVVLWLDVISNLAATDYSREQVRMLNKSEERRHAFILNVLYGAISGAAALEQAGEVGWNPSGDHLVCAIGCPDGTAVPDAVNVAVSAQIERSFAVAALGNTIVLIPLSGDDSDRPDAVQRIARSHGMLVGLAAPRSGVEGLRRAYAEASQALTIARATNSSSVDFDAALLERILLRDPELLREYCERTVGPLIAYDGSKQTELMATLRTYLDCDASPTAAARRLHTHPQTVRYRLRRIGELTGYLPETARGQAQLLIGLSAHALILAESASPRPADPRL